MSNNKTFKILFVIFNLIIYFLFIFALEPLESILILLFKYIIFPIMILYALINIHKNKKYSNEWITFLSKIISIVILLIPFFITISNSTLDVFNIGFTGQSENFLPTIELTTIFIYIIANSILNLINKKEHSKKWITTVFRCSSFLVLLLALLALISWACSFDGILLKGLFILVALSLLLIIFDIRKVLIGDKNTYNIYDYLPLIFTLLLMFIIELAYYVTYSNIYFLGMPLAESIYYYAFFMIPPFILTHLYTYLNLVDIKKEKRKNK